LLRVILTDWEKAGALDLEAVEVAIRQSMHAAGASVLAALLDLRPPEEKQIECPCGGRAKYVEMRPKKIMTMLGELTFSRPYYLCDNCHEGQIPVDRELDVEGVMHSPGVRRMIALVGSQMSFDSGRRQIKELAGLSISVKAVERVSEAIGSDIARKEDERIRKTMSIHQAESLSPVPTSSENPIIYVELDGTGIPVSPGEIDTSKPGKQGDKQKTKEAKVGCVFTQTTADQSGRPVRDESSTTYVGAIESAEDFGGRLYTEARLRGVDQARKVVIIADGAPWIWGLAKTHFPGAIEILDLFHAREHLWKLAAKIFPSDEIARKRWLKRTLKLLDNGRIKRLVTHLRAMCSCYTDLAASIETEADYFERNAHRARYPFFRQQKLFVGSGVIEAACKTVVGLRLKQSGMFWTVKGANSILALRCNRLSNYFEDYWASRLVA
jgi:hypothetical protein